MRQPIRWNPRVKPVQKRVSKIQGENASEKTKREESEYRRIAKMLGLPEAATRARVLDAIESQAFAWARLRDAVRFVPENALIALCAFEWRMLASKRKRGNQ